MSTHGKTDSEATSLTQSSPTRPIYFVQSPSRDSHDGEKTTNSFHSSPAVLSPMGSPGRHSRDSSSSTRFSGSLKPGCSQKSSNNGSRSRNHHNHINGVLKQGEKNWKEFDAIEEEEGLLVDEEYGNKRGGGIIPRRCYIPAFVVGFFLFFAFFSFILWGVSRNQNPTITIKSISFYQFDIQAGSDPSGVTTEFVSMNCSLGLTFRNRGTFFGIHVSSTPLDLSYSQLTVATGTINSFYQSRKSQRFITVAMRGNSIPLYGGGSDLNSKNGKPLTAVPLNLTFTLRAKAYVLGKLVNPKFFRSVKCSVVLDPLKMNVALSLKTSCTYK